MDSAAVQIRVCSPISLVVLTCISVCAEFRLFAICVPLCCF